MTDLSLILPVYTPEAEFIGKVLISILETLDQMKISYECLLVKNGPKAGSTKNISEFVNKHKNIRLFASEPGYGAAVIKGLSEAVSKYVLFMPIDGQVDLGDLPTLWRLAKTGKWHLVKVKRIKRENISRLLVSKILAIVAQMMFGISVVDINGSPKIFPQKYVRLLKLKSKHSLVDLELIVKMQMMDWKIKEIPTKTLARVGGKSSRRISTYFQFIAEMFAFRFSNYLPAWKENVKTIK